MPSTNTHGMLWKAEVWVGVMAEVRVRKPFSSDFLCIICIFLSRASLSSLLFSIHLQIKTFYQSRAEILYPSHNANWKTKFAYRVRIFLHWPKHLNNTHIHILYACACGTFCLFFACTSPVRMIPIVESPHRNI